MYIPITELNEGSATQAVHSSSIIHKNIHRSIQDGQHSNCSMSTTVIRITLESHPIVLLIPFQTSTPIYSEAPHIISAQPPKTNAVISLANEKSKAERICLACYIKLLSVYNGSCARVEAYPFEAYSLTSTTNGLSLFQPSVAGSRLAEPMGRTQMAQRAVINTSNGRIGTVCANK